jgi:hypothetical protein
LEETLLTKQLAFAAFIAVCLSLSACGGGAGSSNAGNVNGNWTATLNNPDGSPAFAFTTSLTQNSNSSSITVTNLSLNTSSPCFVSGTTATGTFGFAGNFNGNVTGTYDMTLSSGMPSGNQLALQGTVNNNTISGTWTLTGGTGCTGAGSFTMNKS